jgi:iron complex transport system substrate-binding protein
MRMRNGLRIFALLALFLCAVAGAEARVLVDMAGRRIETPDRVERVVTLGAVPVLNGFLFALGEGEEIVNGLPPELARKFQYVFAPGLAGKPIVQGGDKGLAVEDVIALKPDLVLTMDVATAQKLQEVGLPVVVLRWTAPEDVKELMTLLGSVFDKEKEAADYAGHFDAAMKRACPTAAGEDSLRRPRVLYVNLRRLTQPHRIADWWIAKAGGRSLTDDGRQQESVTFSLEQLLSWNPEIMIVADQGEMKFAYDDPRFKDVAAFRNRLVYVAPAGAHLWANRTVEQPLTVLWAASVIHPECVSRDELKKEMAAFYARFFKKSLSSDQLDEILAGSVGR